MNCKPNHMAIIIKSTLPENIGKIVTTIQSHESGYDFWDPDVGPIWDIDTGVEVVALRVVSIGPDGARFERAKHKTMTFPDGGMRLLRDDDGPSEELTIYGKPPVIIREKDPSHA